MLGRTASDMTAHDSASASALSALRSLLPLSTAEVAGSTSPEVR